MADRRPETAVSEWVDALWGGAFEDFDSHVPWEWVRQNQFVFPVTSVALYLLGVFLLPSLMPPKGFRLRPLFCIWNAVLGVYSIAGLISCLPFITAGFYHRGLREMLCSDDFMWGGGMGNVGAVQPSSRMSCYGAVGFFMTAFMFGKFVELGDTLFLILMAKPVQLLQWYHHATVLMYCWFAYATATPSALVFGTMNYAVHSIMYPYFSISQYSRILSPIKPLITLIQLSQMVVGLAVCALLWGYVNDGKGCSPTYTPTYFGTCATMYGSYFVLFAHLFYVSYFTKKNNHKNGRNSQKSISRKDK